MELRLNTICSLKFIRLADIIRYEENHDGTATIETTQLTELPIGPGSGRMTVTGQYTDGNELFTTRVTARLKEIIQTRSVGILLVDSCGSGTYIIGTDDLPVTIQPTYTDTAKTIEITHQNRIFPLKTAI